MRKPDHLKASPALRKYNNREERSHGIKLDSIKQKPSDHLKIPAPALKKDTIIAKKQIAVIKIDSTKTKAPLPSIAKQPDHLKVPAPALKKDTIIVKKEVTAIKLDSTKTKAPLPSIAKQPDHLKVPAPMVKKDTISIQKIAKAIDTNKIAEEQHDYQKLFENEQKGKSNKCLAASLNSGKDFALYNDAAVGSYIKVRNLKTNLSTYLKVIGKLPNLSREKQVCLKMSQAASDKISATGKMFLVEIEH
ncbi:MAG: hypothetical protein IPK03_05135 [Bacteroidetes bacterium]|nr:hypothetical protein [Bacteroidota bacterium]